MIGGRRGGSTRPTAPSCDRSVSIFVECAENSISSVYFTNGEPSTRKLDGRWPRHGDRGNPPHGGRGNDVVAKTGWEVKRSFHPSTFGTKWYTRRDFYWEDLPDGLDSRSWRSVPYNQLIRVRYVTLNHFTFANEVMFLGFVCLSVSRISQTVASEFCRYFEG